MNDYWNEPPECPEVPECCDQEMDVNDDGNCQCKICGMLIIAPKDICDYTQELPEP